MSTNSHPARYVRLTGHGNAPSLAAPMSERGDGYVK
jgi:hypothetical protein